MIDTFGIEEAALSNSKQPDINFHGVSLDTQNINPALPSAAKNYVARFAGFEFAAGQETHSWRCGLLILRRLRRLFTSRSSSESDRRDCGRSAGCVRRSLTHSEAARVGRGQRDRRGRAASPSRLEVAARLAAASRGPA